MQRAAQKHQNFVAHNLFAHQVVPTDDELDMLKPIAPWQKVLAQVRDIVSGKAALAAANNVLTLDTSGLKKYYYSSLIYAHSLPMTIPYGLQFLSGSGEVCEPIKSLLYVPTTSGNTEYFLSLQSNSVGVWRGYKIVQRIETKPEKTKQLGLAAALRKADKFESFISSKKELAHAVKRSFTNIVCLDYVSTYRLLVVGSSDMELRLLSPQFETQCAVKLQRTIMSVRYLPGRDQVLLSCLGAVSLYNIVPNSFLHKSHIYTLEEAMRIPNLSDTDCPTASYYALEEQLLFLVVENALLVHKLDTGLKAGAISGVSYSEERACLSKLHGIDSITAVVYYAPFRYTITASRKGIIRVWNNQFSLLYELGGHIKTVTALIIAEENPAWRPAGSFPYLISASQDSTIKIWNLESAQCVQSLHTVDHVIALKMIKKDTFYYATKSEFCVANINTLYSCFNRVNSDALFFERVEASTKVPARILSFMSDNSVRLFNPATGAQLGVGFPTDTDNTIKRVSSVASHGTIAVLFTNGQLALYVSNTNPFTIVELRYTGHLEEINFINQICTVPIPGPDDGSKLLGGTKAGQIVMLATSAKEPDFQPICQAHFGEILLMEVDKTRKILVTHGSDSTLKLWQILAVQRASDTFENRLEKLTPGPCCPKQEKRDNCTANLEVTLRLLAVLNLDKIGKRIKCVALDEVAGVMAFIADAKLYTYSYEALICQAGKEKQLSVTFITGGGSERNLTPPDRQTKGPTDLLMLENSQPNQQRQLLDSFASLPTVAQSLHDQKLETDLRKTAPSHSGVAALHNTQPTKEFSIDEKTVVNVTAKLSSNLVSDNQSALKQLTAVPKLKLWVTLSSGGTVKVWDHDCRLIREMLFSERICAVGIANCRGDLLVGLDREIRAIPVQYYLPQRMLSNLLALNVEDDLEEDVMPYSKTVPFWSYREGAKVKRVAAVKTATQRKENKKKAKTEFLWDSSGISWSQEDESSDQKALELRSKRRQILQEENRQQLLDRLHGDALEFWESGILPANIEEDREYFTLLRQYLIRQSKSGSTSASESERDEDVENNAEMGANSFAPFNALSLLEETSKSTLDNLLEKGLPKEKTNADSPKSSLLARALKYKQFLLEKEASAERNRQLEDELELESDLALRSFFNTQKPDVPVQVSGSDAIKQSEPESAKPKLKLRPKAAADKGSGKEFFTRAQLLRGLAIAEQNAPNANSNAKRRAQLNATLLKEEQVPSKKLSLDQFRDILSKRLQCNKIHAQRQMDVKIAKKKKAEIDEENEREAILLRKKANTDKLLQMLLASDSDLNLEDGAATNDSFTSATRLDDAGGSESRLSVAGNNISVSQTVGKESKEDNALDPQAPPQDLGADLALSFDALSLPQVPVASLDSQNLLCKPESTEASKESDGVENVAIDAEKRLIIDLDHKDFESSGSFFLNSSTNATSRVALDGAARDVELYDQFLGANESEEKDRASGFSNGFTNGVSAAESAAEFPSAATNLSSNLQLKINPDETNAGGSQSCAPRSTGTPRSDLAIDLNLELETAACEDQGERESCSLLAQRDSKSATTFEAIFSSIETKHLADSKTVSRIQRRKRLENPFTVKADRLEMRRTNSLEPDKTLDCSKGKTEQDTSNKDALVERFQLLSLTEEADQVDETDQTLRSTRELCDADSSALLNINDPIKLHPECETCDQAEPASSSLRGNEDQFDTANSSRELGKTPKADLARGSPALWASTKSIVAGKELKEPKKLDMAYTRAPNRSSSDAKAPPKQKPKHSHLYSFPGRMLECLGKLFLEGFSAGVSSDLMRFKRSLPRETVKPSYASKHLKGCTVDGDFAEKFGKPQADGLISGKSKLSAILNSGWYKSLYPVDVPSQLSILEQSRVLEGVLHNVQLCLQFALNNGSADVWEIVRAITHLYLNFQDEWSVELTEGFFNSLCQLGRSDDPFLRNQFAVTIGCLPLRHLESLELLVSLMADKDEKVKLAALDALSDLNVRSAADFYAAVLELGGSEDAIGELQSALKLSGFMPVNISSFAALWKRKRTDSMRVSRVESWIRSQQELMSSTCTLHERQPSYEETLVAPKANSLNFNRADALAPKSEEDADVFIPPANWKGLQCFSSNESQCTLFESAKTSASVSRTGTARGGSAKVKSKLSSGKIVDAVNEGTEKGVERSYVRILSALRRSGIGAQAHETLARPKSGISRRKVTSPPSKDIPVNCRPSTARTLEHTLKLGFKR